MSNTQDNLKAAFAGESQANRRYLFFADRARDDGHPQICRLFRAVADAETVHAHAHLDVMGGIKSTQDNLKEAIDGEHYEFTRMYPEFIKQAETEGNKRARVSFGYANEVEKLHHELYQKALEAVKTGQKMKDEPYFVCQVCGNTVAGEPPEKCPICGAAKFKFKKIE